MSMVFDGIIVKATSDKMTDVFREIHTPIEYAWGPITDDVFAVYPAGGRRHKVDFPQLEIVAEQFSLVLGHALLVVWDDRVGTDLSVLFSAGKRRREFGPSEQRYKLLDLDGMPLKDGPQFRSDELVDQEEYECTRHAIDAGLEQLGISADISLQELMRAFYNFE